MADEKQKRDRGGLVTFKAAGAEDPGEIEGYASFKSVDRYGELVLPSAFANTIEQFLKNPIMCLGHDSSGSPYSGLADGGGLPIGSFDQLSIADEGLKYHGIFARTPIAQLVRGLYQDRHMRAASIGFWVKQNGWRDPTAEELAQYGASLKRVITEVELAEISLVPLPANRESLALAVRAFGPAGTGSPEDILQVRSFMEAVLQRLAPPPAKPVSKASPELQGLFKALSAAYQVWVEVHSALGGKLVELEKLIEAGEDHAGVVEGLAAGLAAEDEKAVAFVDALKGFTEEKQSAGADGDWSAVLQGIKSLPVKL